jgi:hypothetical protein
MSEIDAVVARALERANEVLQGTRAPYEGARELWRLSNDLSELVDALRPFAGLASEWEDNPAHRSEYENDIRIEAETFRRRFGK